eukprot:7889724-Pyramimonas_sp.AAC.1
MDASPSTGAAVSTPAPAGLVAHFWRYGERRGAHSRRESAPRTALQEIGQLGASAESDHFDGGLRRARVVGPPFAAPRP